MNEVYELISRRRTIRKFQQKPLPEKLLKSLCKLGRLAPSGANLQPLRYVTVEGEEARKKLFSSTKWAGYLPGELGKPSAETAPMGYIIVLADTNVSKMSDTDAGLALENMILGALSEGVASCILGALNREAIAKDFALPGNLFIHSVLALGYPAMESSVKESDETPYFYEGELLVVPKLSLGSLLLAEF